MNSILIILAEFLFVSFVILGLFSLRNKFGLAPLYIFVGAIQYFQTILATFFFIPIFDKFYISPGSIILFSSSLFALLLVYIKEGVHSTRSLIAGIIVANISLTILSVITKSQEYIFENRSSASFNSELFHFDLRLFTVGTVTLIFDFFLVVIVYKFLHTKAKGMGLFAHIFFSLFTVLCFDSLVFTTGSFYGNSDFTVILTGQFIGKSIAALFFAAVLFLYIRYMDTVNNKTSKFIADQTQDIFSIITYRKKYEALKEEKAMIEKRLSSQLTDTLNSMFDGFILADIRGKILDVNPAYEKMVSYSRKELLTMNISQVEAQFSKVEIDARVAQIVEKGFLKFETKHKTKSGELIDLDVSISIMHLEYQPVIAAFLRNITDRKKAELALIESEEKFAVAFHDSIISLAIINSESRYVDLNKAFEKLIGVKREDLINKTSVEAGLLAIVDLRERKKIAEKIKTYGKLINEEMDTILENGKPLQALYSIDPVVIAGKAHWLLSLQDISEIKKTQRAFIESEERYRSLIENSPDIIMQLDLEENVQFINKTEGGFTNEQIIGASAYEFMLPEFHELVREMHIKVIATKKQQSYETAAMGQDGIKRWYHTNVGPLIIGEIVKGFTLVTRDITERKSAEKELSESEIRLRAILEAEPECIKQIGPNNELIYMNPAGLAMIEAESIEIVKGNSILGIITQEHRKEFQKLTQSVFKGETGKLEFEIKGLKGTHRWLETHAVPLRDSEGKIISLIGITREITERKKAEETIKESERKYRSLIEQASDAILIYSFDGVIHEFNESAWVSSGYSEDEYSKLNLKDLLVGDLSENQEKYQMILKGETVLLNRQFRKKDGSISEMEIKVKLQTEGKVIAFARDITERKKAEEQIQNEKEHSDSIINSLPGIFYLFDANRKILRWNKNFQILTGYTDREIREINPLNFFDSEGQKLVQDNFEKTMLDGRAGFETDFITKKGEKIPYYFTGLRVIYEGGPCLIGTGINIRERKMAEDELNKTASQLRLLTHHLQNVREEERKIISREIHDELGQQLTAIKMDVAWIDKNSPDIPAPVKFKIKSIISLLDESNLSVKKILSELRADILTNLGLIDALEWQGYEFSEKTGMPLSFNRDMKTIKVEEPVAICIFRVYQEALTNIIKYAQAKKVVTSLMIKEDIILFSIEDDGVGFDSNELKKNRSFGILGMKERVNSVNGKFELISSQGKGTKIIVEIPHKVSANS